MAYFLKSKGIMPGIVLEPPDLEVIKNLEE